MAIDTFAIGFDHRDRARLHALWDDALDAEVWSEGTLTRAFEDAWAAWNGLPAVGTNGWTGAGLAAPAFYGLRREKGLCPSNPLMAAPPPPQCRRASLVFGLCHRAEPLTSLHEFPGER